MVEKPRFAQKGFEFGSNFRFDFQIYGLSSGPFLAEDFTSWTSFYCSSIRVWWSDWVWSSVSLVRSLLFIFSIIKQHRHCQQPRLYSSRSIISLWVTLSSVFCSYRIVLVLNISRYLVLAKCLTIKRLHFNIRKNQWRYLFYKTKNSVLRPKITDDGEYFLSLQNDWISHMLKQE